MLHKIRVWLRSWLSIAVVAGAVLVGILVERLIDFRN
jgi:hypothetical protein